MDSISEPTTTQYQQVTVDVPEERVAEFHAFFARFLVGRVPRGRRGGYRHHAHGRRYGCTHRHERSEQREAYDRPTEAPGQTRETTEA